MLEEKIETIKFGKKQNPLCKIDLELSYVIPDEEFDSEADKLAFFRDIEAIESLEDLSQIESTFSWNNSSLPMKNLFLMLRSSLILRSYQVERVAKMGQNYHFEFSPESTPAVLRDFLTRLDPHHEMIIVSLGKIKIESKLFRGPEDFLEKLIERAES
jgi:transcription-repair coupling factor (superfamily II helicase)